MQFLFEECVCVHRCFSYVEVMREAELREAGAATGDETLTLSDTSSEYGLVLSALSTSVISA